MKLLIIFLALLINSHIFAAEKLHIESNGNLGTEVFTKFIIDVNNDINPFYVRRLVATYISLCELEGINHDIAIAQMILETGYLRFGGDVLAEQNNFCGLGATGNGAPGNSFETMEEGILAHIQHLKGYGSIEPLVTQLVDPRFKWVARGSAQRVFDLTGKWAMDPGYGYKISMIINQIYLELNKK